MLESALAAGIAAAGGDALLAGVLPTPAAAILVRRLGLDLAAVVSASHNPYQDNGIKFFSAQGTKLPDDVEARLEALMEGDGPPPAAEPGRIEELNGGEDDYVRELRCRLPDRPLRPQGDARLRQRRHLPGRAADLRGARGERRDDRRRARRPQHQRGRRLHPRRGAGRAGRRLRRRGRLRLRRRRRPGARRRRRRARPRRRRADRARRPRPGLARGARRRRRRHRDDQLRLPPGDEGGRDRGRRSPRSATAT